MTSSTDPKFLLSSSLVLFDKILMFWVIPGVVDKEVSSSVSLNFNPCGIIIWLFCEDKFKTFAKKLPKSLFDLISLLTFSILKSLIKSMYRSSVGELAGFSI